MTLELGEHMIENSVATIEQITAKIYHIRGNKVMLDRDLAELYGVDRRRPTLTTRSNVTL